VRPCSAAALFEADPLVQIDGVLTDVKDLTAQQASLSADKQEISKRLAERMREGERLMAFVDTCVRQRYGNRSEKLVEFGLQPFRPQPRVRLSARTASR
jgi:hypothetical protein